MPALRRRIVHVAYRLVGDGIAAVGGIVAKPVGRLDVVGVGRHGLNDPVVSVGRLAARIVEVVQQREALDQASERSGEVDAAEDGQGGIAIAGGHVAQDLVVGAVFTNDDETRA